MKNGDFLIAATFITTMYAAVAIMSLVPLVFRFYCPAVAFRLLLEYTFGIQRLKTA